MVHAFHGGAFERDEEVHGDRIGVESAQRVDRFDDLLIRFAHAHDQARTWRQAPGLRLLHGVRALFERVGGADFFVVRFGGVEVVVVRVNTVFLESFGLVVLEESQARAHFQLRVRVLDRLGDFTHPVDVTVRRPAPGGHEAHATRATFHPEGRLAGGVLGAQPGVLEDLRVRSQTLRAVPAVLGAQAGLEVDQVVHLHGHAKVLPAHPCRGRDDVQEVFVSGA